MITSFEQHKIFLERLEVLEIPGRTVRNELEALQRSNDLLREQSVSLQSRNEELEAYAHTVAHALKNPLAVMIVTCSAISEITDLTPQELREYIQQIKTTAYEMNGIIDSLMLLSKVGQMDMPVETVDMDSVIANTRKRLSSLVKEYRGRIISPKSWPVAIGYAPWIEEVWANYISNALKYGGRSPRVELGASTQPDGMIRFWARDNGPGIPLKNQARLFAPFTRFNLVHRPGHGLGLSIVRRIVEKLGGQVGVESQVGKGSLFYFTLPASPAIMASVPERIPDANQTSGRRTSGYRPPFQQSHHQCAYRKE